MDYLIWFLLIIIGLSLVSSCRSLAFSEHGDLFEDVDKYFNKKEGVNVWMYRSFVPKENAKTGVRVASFYPLDDRMLDLLKLKNKRNKILFSAIPESSPQYNFIAIKHNRQNVKLKEYKKLEYKKAIYYQRDYSFDGIDIRHAYIPYGKNKALSLVYYALEVEHKKCPFCRCDYLAKINALERLEDSTYLSTWQIYDCSEEFRKQAQIIPNKELLKDQQKVFLKMYDINGINKSISFFKLI
ncbi:MAG: hypothetical protein ACRDE7_08535, partial [Sphingobacterium sp.]